MAVLANNAYSQYANNRILQASPAELTLLLYEGAIKFVNIAIIAIENKDIEKAHTNIMKTQRIIEEFQLSLNFKYEIANDFNNVYIYIMQRLREANLTKDKEILEEVNAHLRVMRDTWREVMKIANN